MPNSFIQEWAEPRSEEVQEILQRNPAWILRWGISTFLLVITGMLTASWFIRYPDVIAGNVLVTGKRPPVALVAQSSGSLAGLFVMNGQKVKKGTVAALIENTAKYGDVLRVEGIVDTLMQVLRSNDSFPSVTFNGFTMGELQPLFEKLCKANGEFEAFRGSDMFGKKIRALKKEAGYYDEYARHTWLQSLTLLKEYELAQKKHRIDSLLEKGGAIASAQLDETKSFLLQRKYSYQSALSQVSQAKISKAEMEKNIAELEIQNHIEQRRLIAELTSSLESLENALAEWKKKYLLVVPVDGTINFFDNLSENRFIKTGDEVMVVVPAGSREIVGRIQVPVEGSAKVEEGQAVKIRLLNYPYEEYGLLEGKISSISSVTKNNFYEAEVIFSGELITSFGKTLPFRHQMQGRAEIITKERTILERLFDKFISIAGYKTKY